MKTCHSSRHVLVATVVLTFSGLCQGQGSQGSLGFWVHLRTPDGFVDSRAADINNKIEVVGSMTTPQGVMAPFLYRDGRMSEIFTGNPRGGGWAAAINDDGLVVGGVRGSNNRVSPFFTGQPAGLAVLSVPGTVYSAATHVDFDGAMLLRTYAQDPATPNAPVTLYHFGGGLTQLGEASPKARAAGIAFGNMAWTTTTQFPFGDATQAFVGQVHPINGPSQRRLGTLGGSWATAEDASSFHVTGNSATAGAAGDGPSHAYRWDAFPSPGSLVDLGTLGGPSSEAVAISDDVQVAGVSDTGDGTRHAFLHDGERMIDLGTLGGTNSAAVEDINARENVIGVSELAETDALGRPLRHAFLYTDGHLFDLHASLATSFPDINYIDPDSVLINDMGHIVLYGITASGLRGSFVLIPIPEPPFYLMMLAGLAVMGIVLKRRGRDTA